MITSSGNDHDIFNSARIVPTSWFRGRSIHFGTRPLKELILHIMYTVRRKHHMMQSNVSTVWVRIGQIMFVHS
jgi:hypothetical protein